MRVRELLQSKTGPVITVGAADTIETAVRLLIRHRVGGLAVTDDHGTLTGFIGERDIVEVVNRHPGDVRDVRVSHVMQPPPTCGLEDELTRVMSRMTDERQRHLVAVAEGRPVGVISVGDIVKQRLLDLEVEAGVLRDYVAARRAV
jgi:CBS domain-containing protein